MKRRYTFQNANSIKAYGAIEMLCSLSGLQLLV